jgi:hypothetical protein
MPRRCLTCWHPECEKIEAALRNNVSLRDVSKTYGISKDALHRHWKNCFPLEYPVVSPTVPGGKSDTSGAAPNNDVPTTSLRIAQPITSPAAQFVIVHRATGDRRVVTGKYC